jgi:flavin-dependent dehydrogenase
MEKTDILVIGAGPAGCAAAITAARCGAGVVLIEKEAFPRYRPGETLHPGIEPLFEQLGVSKTIEEAGFPRHRGIWNASDGERCFIAYGSDSRGDWLGWQIPGETLDAILLAQAVALGVNVAQPCRAEKLLVKNERLRGVQTNQGSIAAAVVIDATGPRCFLARRLCLSQQRSSPPLLAQFGYVRGHCAELEEGPLFEKLPLGWLWSAQISNELLHWTRLLPLAAPVERGYLPARFTGLPVAMRSFFRDVTWRHAPDCARADYFVVGDAAIVFDPSSSHGVLRAIMSGIMAAHVIANSTDLDMAARQYRQWLQAWYRADLEQLRRMSNLKTAIQKE